MSLVKMFSQLGRTYLSPPVARIAKLASLYPHYWTQVQASHVGYLTYQQRYPQRILFIAGMPKSGTTWLKNMLSHYPGFQEVMIPEHWIYAMRVGNSHCFDMPPDVFSRIKQQLVLMRLHIYGSPHNVALLSAAGVRHVVLYRDLRDVAVSHYFYVRQYPWHPEYQIYKDLSVQEALVDFAYRLLPDYIHWIRSWHQNRNPELSLIVRYEEMLTDPVQVLTAIVRHFQLGGSDNDIKQIVATHSFQSLSKGRMRGEEDQHSFLRKGVAGDWQNYFTPALKDVYKQRLDDFLIEFGYERTNDW